MAMWRDDEGDDDDGFGFDVDALFDQSPEAKAYADEWIESIRTPLADGDPRRHHFIPQCHLRRFADGDKRIARISIDDPHRRDVTNIKNVAVVSDLYTIIDEQIGETMAVERLLAALDGAVVAPIERLAYGVLFPPQRQDRLTMAMWLSFLHVRGPSFRRHYEAMTDNLFKLDMSLIRDEATARAWLMRDNNRPEPTDEEVRELLDAVEDLDDWEVSPHQNEMVKQMLYLAKRATPFFLCRYWVVTKFSQPGLVLPDSPLVMYQKPEHHSPWLGVGLATADEIWFPLDRSTLLTLHTDGSVGDKVIRPPFVPDIDHVNEFLVSQAHREVYCHPDDVRRLDGIAFPDPDRPIMTVNGGGWNRGSTDGVNKPPERKGHRRYRSGA
jgi:hypothetical protein